MRKYVINGRFLCHRITGVERYARELIRALDLIVPRGTIKLAVPHDLNDIPSYQNIEVVRVGHLSNRLWEHISLPIYVRREGAVCISLCNVAPLLRPDIVCIHDVKVKARPQEFSILFRIWYKVLFFNQTKRATKILTVSEFSKSEICKYYHLEPSRIIVIPDGWQHFKSVGFSENVLRDLSLKPNEYFFSLGSLEPNKNLKWIAHLAINSPCWEFIVAGSVNNSVFSEGLGFDLPDNLRLIGYISDEQAKTLMRDCRAFIFPSFYEGFGIPPLEALSAGAKEVIVSDIPVMHEIFGSNAVFIDPFRYSYRVNNLVFKNNTTKKASLLAKYSWRHSAEKLQRLLYD